MKKKLLAHTLAISLGLVSVHGLADDFYADDSGEITTLKGITSFGATAVLGGIVAGPIGVIAGAVGGSFLGKELEKADQYELTESALRQQQDEFKNLEQAFHSSNTALKQQLRSLEQERSDVENLALNELELQLLFHTGSDTLDEAAMKRLDKLAIFLKRNPELTIRLHGHADPRGSDGYNQVLAQYRALNVQSALEFYGIQSQRIERYSYGANQSRAVNGDLDAYALERKVTVQIVPEQEGGFASVD